MLRTKLNFHPKDYYAYTQNDKKKKEEEEIYFQLNQLEIIEKYYDDYIQKEENHVYNNNNKNSSKKERERERELRVTTL